MKTKLTTVILALTAGFALAHEGIELGPNKGRILEFSTDETMHGEVTEKEGKRQAPVKMEVAKDETGFAFPAANENEWIIMQYKESPDSKTITVRLHFITKTCAPCGQPEWRCACGEKEKK